MSSSEYPIYPITGIMANADFKTTDYTGYYICLNSSGKGILGVTTCAGGLGILLNKPYTNEPMEIAGPGSICYGVAGAAIAPGDVVMLEEADAGKLIKATNDNVICGLALETASADLARFQVLILTPHLCADVSDEGVANS